MASKQVVLWPPVEGYVYDHGKPVKGLEIKETINWNANNGKSLEFTQKTDENGHFRFERVTGEFNLNFFAKLLHQPSVGYVLETTFNGELIGLDGGINSSYMDPKVPTKGLAVQYWDFKNVQPLGDSKIVRSTTGIK